MRNSVSFCRVWLPLLLTGDSQGSAAGGLRTFQQRRCLPREKKAGDSMAEGPMGAVSLALVDSRIAGQLLSHNQQEVTAMTNTKRS